RNGLERRRRRRRDANERRNPRPPAEHAERPRARAARNDCATRRERTHSRGRTQRESKGAHRGRACCRRCFDRGRARELACPRTILNRVSSVGRKEQSQRAKENTTTRGRNVVFLPSMCSMWFSPPTVNSLSQCLRN